MNFFFTICSNNYLAQAIVLGNSLRKHEPGYSYLVGLVDEINGNIDYDSIPFEVLPVHLIVGDISGLAEKYDIIELNTCVKPAMFEYLFQKRDAEKVIYLDPDVKLFGALSELDEIFITHDIALTPHINTPIPLDGKTPAENLFLNYGIYNLGFLALKKGDETGRFLMWWKERTFSLGFDKVHQGMFVDQLPVNLVPVFFERVAIIREMGYNMAPWNLHERVLSVNGGDLLVNNRERLKFFHFSSFRIDSGELPLHNYNRYVMADRPDLEDIYNIYNSELREAGYLFYSPIKCHYVIRRELLLKAAELKKWQEKPFIKKITIRIARMFPLPLRKKLAKVGYLN